MHKKNLLSLKYIGYLLVVIALVAFDQFTKLLAVDKLKDKDSFVIWDGVFEFSYVENRGAAFGMQQGMIPMFIIITFVIIPVVIFLIHKIDRLITVMGDKVNKKAFCLLQIDLVILIAGAIGNLIDRIVNGYVVDFLYFKLIDFPVFNIADCYVTISTIALFIICFFMLKESEVDYIISSQKKWPVVGDTDAEHADKYDTEEDNETIEDSDLDTDIEDDTDNENQ